MGRSIAIASVLPTLPLSAYRRRRLLDRLDGIDGVHGQVAHGRCKATLCV